MLNELKSVPHLEAILKNEIMTIDHPTQIRVSDTELFFFYFSFPFPKRGTAHSQPVSYFIIHLLPTVTDKQGAVLVATLYISMTTQCPAALSKPPVIYTDTTLSH